MVTIDETNGLGFRAYFENLRGALELQIFDHRHDVSVSEHGTIGIFDDAIRVWRVNLNFFRPFMTAGHALEAVGVR